MSLDFCFWKVGDGVSVDLYEWAADGDYSHFTSSDAVSAFRAELIARWPDIADSVEPLEYDPISEEWEDISRCVLVTLSLARSDLAPELIKLASTFGLIGYDPQREIDLA
jgi:hypothetical protein